MTDPDQLRAATAVGVLASEEAHLALLGSIVDVARAIFGAQASSIFLLDEDTGELVFEAASGLGSAELVGSRFPSGTGIAGWVLATRQPLVLEDVSKDPRFARDLAEATGYVPRALMAVPLLHEERALGVLEVLDRAERARSPLEEMDLLGLFAGQAAIALDLLQAARRAKAVLAGSGGELMAVARVAEALDALEGEARDAGLRLLEAARRGAPEEMKPGAGLPRPQFGGLNALMWPSTSGSSPSRRIPASPSRGSASSRRLMWASTSSESVPSLETVRSRSCSDIRSPFGRRAAARLSLSRRSTQPASSHPAMKMQLRLPTFANAEGPASSVPRAFPGIRPDFS